MSNAQLLKKVGADAIYATNKNRNIVTKAGIQTDFKKKGRKGRYETSAAKYPK